MSRSYYHSPWMGCTGRRSCKAWRSQENRRYRRYTKSLLHKERYDDIIPYKGKWGNEWDSPRDGRTYFGHYHNVPCIPIVDPNPLYLRICTTGCLIERDLHFCYKEYNKLLRK